VTDSPSEMTPEEVAAEGDRAGDSLAAAMAAAVGATSWSNDNGTVHLAVPADGWAAAVATAAEKLPFFSWLSAVDWSREVEVGEPADDVENLEERFEVLCRLSSVTNSDAVILVTQVPKSDAAVASIVDVFPGAGWHEREAAEMFGIDFAGNPNLSKLYLPDSFEGNPLLKSYPLLAREVKPWPGTVDVEDMPSTENTEAAAVAGGGEE
jgi:NADH-quinone oxidoreductase subunit C